MNHPVLALTAAALLLSGSLAVAVKVAQSRGRKVKSLEGALAEANAELSRREEYRKKREEAQKNADEKKQTLHTGDDVADFNNSLDVLHGAGQARGK